MSDMQKNEKRKMNPLLSIWIHPKQTTRYVVDNKSLFYMIFLLSLGYIGATFSGLMDTELYPTLPQWLILLLVIILSPFIGILSNAFSALGIWLIGKLFQGVATFKESFVAASLSIWPFITTIPFYIYWLFADPKSLFFSDEVPNGAFIFIVFIVIICAVIWSIIITIGAIAEVHRISNWKAFFTCLIFYIIYLLILFIIYIIVFLIALAIMFMFA